MPPSDLSIRQGNLWVRVKQLERKLSKHNLLTELEFDEIHRTLIDLDEKLMKLKSDIYT